MYKKTIALCLAVLICWVIVGYAGGETINRVASERRVLADVKGISISNFISSPNSRRMAFAVSRGIDGRDGWAVFVDDKEEQTFRSINKIVFSPDSKRVAYEACGLRWTVVVDGKKIGEYPWVTSLIFSPDSKRVAYLAGKRKPFRVKLSAVVDGEGGPYYDNIDSLMFSPDSKQLVYRAKKGGKWFLVLDGKEEKKYDEYLSPVFSPDGKRLAYAVRMGKKWSMVVNGKEGKQYDKCLTPVFSPDSRRIAYAAAIDKKWCIVVDGEEGKFYESRSFFSPNVASVKFPVFSPDSKCIAYAAVIGKEFFAVVDAEEQECGGNSISDLTFSPNSKRLAYVVDTEADWSPKRFVVVDEKRENFYSAIENLVFSPDSKWLAYVAQQDSLLGESTKFVVAGGKEGKHYSRIYAQNFSKDATIRLAERYSINNREKMIVFESPVDFHYYVPIERSKHIKGDVYIVEERIEGGVTL